jgi:TM2 domain-containing membrane protein YozV
MTSAEYESTLMRSMNDAQRALFAAEMMPLRKNEQTGTLFALLLGGIGAHRFYLGDMLGIVYVLFFWTLVPALISFLELFWMAERVARHNKQQAYLVATRIRASTHFSPSQP